MITIRDDVTVRLQARYDRLLKVFGRFDPSIKNVNDFAAKIITDYINKKEAQELNEQNNKQNNGITWVLFRRSNFDQVYIRDKGCCKYCTKHLSKKESTLDHILSPLRGGQNRLDNVTIACEWCNKDKGILTDEEYFYKQLVNQSKGIKPPGRRYISSISSS